MTAGDVTVRAAATRDRAAFLAMWQNFVATAPGEPGHSGMGEPNWRRIDAQSLSCLVAVDAADRPLGFTLFLAFPFTWSRGDVCYLQDIFVSEAARGRGVGRAMIEHLRELGLRAGWFKIFWMTQPDNLPAQRLYDRVAERMDYLRYDLTLDAPQASQRA